MLQLSIETADKNNSTVILANDPDADRFQLAEKQPELVQVFCTLVIVNTQFVMEQLLLFEF